MPAFEVSESSPIPPRCSGFPPTPSGNSGTSPSVPTCQARQPCPVFRLSGPRLFPELLHNAFVSLIGHLPDDVAQFQHRAMYSRLYRSGINIQQDSDLLVFQLLETRKNQKLAFVFG